MRAFRLVGMAIALGLTMLAGWGSGAKEPTGPWRFAVLADSRGDKEGSKYGVRTAILAPLALQIATEGVDLVLFPGDAINGSPDYGDIRTQLTQWKYVMAPLLNRGIPIYMSRGNHEVLENEISPTPGSAVELANFAAWKAIFPNLPQNGPASQLDATYSVDHRNARFVVFDQYLGRKSTYDSEQYDSKVNSGTVDPWVISQIASATQPWVFVAAHEPMFIIHHTDCMANDPVGRDQLLDALGARAGGGVYFCGHDHGYWRAIVPDAAGHDVYQLLVGCAGAPFYAADNVARNADYDRKVVPQILFANGAVASDTEASHTKASGAKAPDAATPGPEASPAVSNNRDLRPMWGYLLVTVYGQTATAEWKALTNADPSSFTVNGKPVFKTYDTFVMHSSR
jgi:hypothetical protein